MLPAFEEGRLKIYQGDVLDVLRQMPDGMANCCVTSPPYWGLRDYGVDGQLGLESTPEEFIVNMVEVFREVRRVLRDDGTCWINIGDSYAGSWGAQGRQGTTGAMADRAVSKVRGGIKPLLHHNQIAAHPKLESNTGSLSRTPGCKNKDLVGIPWMLAFALRADGWYLRQDIIWHKPNPMPESVRDRCTKAHEYIFLLSKSERYFYNFDAIKEPLAEASIARLSQDVANQLGSDRVPGKTNGRMKAVRFGGGKYGDSEAEETRTKSGNEWEPSTDTRNKRSVWSVTTQPYSEAHFATFPEALIEPCILAGCPPGGVVLEPFSGSGTTLKVARDMDCNAVGIELNPEYIDIAKRRLRQGVLAFTPPPTEQITIGVI